MGKHIHHYLIDESKSECLHGNRDYQKMLKDFGGSEILSRDRNFISIMEKDEVRVNSNVRMDKKTGIKVLYLEEYGEEGYWEFMFYFR